MDRGGRAVVRTVSVAAPFRLDLTVAALRRIPANPVDRWEGGRYRRAFETRAGPVAWTIEQARGAARLRVALHGAVDDPRPWLGRVRRVLGTSLDLAPFYARARRLARVAPLVARFAGAKPPRFAGLWESFLMTVPFQQLSLQSAMAAVDRLVRRFSEERALGEVRLRAVPPPERVAAASLAELRALGLSGTKAATLRDVAGAMARGELSEEALEPLGTEAIRARLLSLRGVGPWTADLLLLRGFRRLEVFPGGAVAVERGLAELLGGADPAPVRAALGPWRGMFYFHFLLRSLANRGLVGAAPE